MPVTADQEQLAVRGGMGPLGAGRRVNGQVHALRNAARNAQGRRIRTVGFQLGEVQPTVQNRCSRGKHYGVCRERAFAGGDLQGLLRAHILNLHPLHNQPAVFPDIAGQGLKDLHGVDLRLVFQLQRLHYRERQSGITAEMDIQTRVPRNCGLFPEPLAAVVGGCEGDRGPALKGDALLLHILREPGLSRLVGFHVGLHHLKGILAAQGRKRSTLEEAELPGGVAGGHRTESPCFKDHHALPGPGQEQRCHHSGEAGAHHNRVKVLLIGDCVGREMRCAVQP
ncbi:hypothetical protein D3C73_989580 [compost metagenome]